VRHALAVWEVNTVVVATDPVAPVLQQGHDPTYTAAFFTGALGRPPRLEAGAWVWNNVQLGLHAPLHTPSGTLARCVAQAEGTMGRVRADQRAPSCVVAASAAHRAPAAALPLPPG
jgi:hypothetical protein